MTKSTPQIDGKKDLSVEVIGTPVLRCALETYLQTLLVNLKTQGKAKRIVLMVGQEGQESIKNERASGRTSRKNTRYILLSRGADIDYSLARDLPICGFVADDDPPETLVEGLNAAAADGVYCSPRLVPSLVAAALPAAEPAALPALTYSAGESSLPLAQANHGKTKGSIRPKHPLGLSLREAEIVSHAAHGLSNDEIASTLFLSLPTIKFHLYRAYQKMGIRRRSQLAGMLAGAN